MEIQRYRHGFPETGVGRFKLHFVVPVSLMSCKGRKNIFPPVPCGHSSHWGQLSPGSHRIPTGGGQSTNSSDSLPVPPYLFKA